MQACTEGRLGSRRVNVYRVRVVRGKGGKLCWFERWSPWPQQEQLDACARAFANTHDYTLLGTRARARAHHSRW